MSPVVLKAVLWSLAGAVALLVIVWTTRAAQTLSALAWMPIVTRRLARWVWAHPLTEDELFGADGAGPAIVARRRSGMAHLASTLELQQPQSAAWGRALRDGFSDLRFTDTSRVPYAFASVMREKFNLYTVVTASHGPYLEHLDGHRTLDVSGSYGLNVAGWERYKTWIDRGWDRVRGLGPVLGAVHPVIADNIARLKTISGLDEVSFHMSGTEAVMAAVRLARFNTHRRLIVTFSGAYHGWWDGVQPGLGSERRLDDCLTLQDMRPASLDVIRRRAGEIAAVLVNPVQSFHPNTPPPNDAVLLSSQMRQASATTTDYARWLRDLCDVCRLAGVPLILDEVYTGFRLAPGGAREYFRIDADLIVYGKTVGGGLPIGVVCGRSALMRRTDPAHPLRMAYVVGTFSAHPLVMASMNEFLHWLDEPATPQIYLRGNQRCADWVDRINARFLETSMPVRIVQLATIWTVLFAEPSRFNWLFQYYLRAEGVTLSWVGTGRCLASLDFTDEDYTALTTKLLNAAERMQADGWWVTTIEFPERNRLMRLHLRREIIGSLVPVSVVAFYQAVMRRKDDDHHASHNNMWNQYLHLLSSATFIYCYAILFADLTQAMFLGLAALFVRQFGHAVLEPACHSEEEKLLGFSTPNKTLIVAGFVAIPLLIFLKAGTWSVDGFMAAVDTIAVQWFRYTLAVVLGRVAFLAWKFDIRTASIWFVKLVTDPFTDLTSYRPWRPQGA